MTRKAYIIVDGARVDVDLSDVHYDYTCDGCGKPIDGKPIVDGTLAVKPADQAASAVLFAAHPECTAAALMTAVSNALTGVLT